MWPAVMLWAASLQFSPGVVEQRLWLRVVEAARAQSDRMLREAMERGRRAERPPS